MTFDQLDLNGTYTYEDYLKWSFEERLELIRGKVFKMSPAPARRHQSISTNISDNLFQYLRNTSCKLYAAPFAVRLAPSKRNAIASQVLTVVQPDICVICDPEKLDERGCIGAPDLIVEILSPGNSTKELKDKFEVYEENGVKEYWLVDPTEKAIFIYLLNNEHKFVGLKPVTEDQILRSTVLSGFEMPVADVFAD